ncbi:MAG: hypothetical protein IIC58_00250 [Proteobacteria bacterium]|nr:hypothetical protein [Pseudomonadota bacterium]
MNKSTPSKQAPTHIGIALCGLGKPVGWARLVSSLFRSPSLRIRRRL